MIVRKPYAFLIKNFRFIHFLILIFSTYILYKSKLLFDFFNKYASTRQVLTAENIAHTYVPTLLIIFSFIVVALSLIIFILLKTKDKPKTLYFVIICYYVAFIVFSFISRGAINTIVIEGLAPKEARLLRDISLIAFIIQIIFSILFLVRTLGFDIKKFHFGEDLESLEIDVTDNEEIELISGIDTDKVLRNFEMQKENWKVFFIENKTIIIMILFLALVIIPTTFIVKNNVANRRYEINEVIDLNNFNLRITDVYVTKYDYKGKQLLKGNKSYLIVKFNLYNLSAERGIILNNLRIEAKSKIYTPNTTHYASFIDIGNGYYDQKIEPEKSNDYIAIYIINDDDLNNEMVLRYTDKITYNKKGVNTLYKRVNIKPVSLDNIKEGQTVKLNEELDFSTSNLNNTTLTLTGYGVKDNYTYKVNNNTKYIVNKEGKVLKLTYDLNLDENISYITDFKDFIEKYAHIIYLYDNKEYTLNIKDITPVNYKDKDIFLSADENIGASSNIRIEFNVRNIKYTYVLK